jgi:hypothetical protein
MRCIRRTAAIAANEQLISGAQTLLNQVCDLRYLRVKVEKRLQRLVRRSDCSL